MLSGASRSLDWRVLLAMNEILRRYAPQNDRAGKGSVQSNMILSAARNPQILFVFESQPCRLKAQKVATLSLHHRIAVR
jgi:hypothetical protein